MGSNCEAAGARSALRDVAAVRGGIHRRLKLAQTSFAIIGSKPIQTDSHDKAIFFLAHLTNSHD
jgi:hypothetical protein